MYIAPQQSHIPLSAPYHHKAYERKKVHRILESLTSEKRNLFAKTLVMLDLLVEDVVDALTERDMWDNTIFIFSSDNGACPNTGGSNLPYRGMKNTMYEGGARVPPFITSPLFGNMTKGREKNTILTEQR